MNTTTVSVAVSAAAAATAAAERAPPPAFVGGARSASVEQLLEKERADCKSEKWNRLDNAVRLEKLQEFAAVEFERLFASTYLRPESGRDVARGVRELQAFFALCLQKKKLVKVKDIVYDRDSGKIVNVPFLHYHSERDMFYVKNNDIANQTLKSLTPKRGRSNSGSG